MKPVTPPAHPILMHTIRLGISAYLAMQSAPPCLVGVPSFWSPALLCLETSSPSLLFSKRTNELLRSDELNSNSTDNITRIFILKRASKYFQKTVWTPRREGGVKRNNYLRLRILQYYFNLFNLAYMCPSGILVNRRMSLFLAVLCISVWRGLAGNAFL